MDKAIQETVAAIQIRFPLADVSVTEEDEKTIFSIGLDGYFISEEQFAERFFVGLKEMGTFSIFANIYSQKVYDIVNEAAQKQGFLLATTEKPFRFEVKAKGE